jgi:outer membrane receptor protein involved in Fe transport
VQYNVDDLTPGDAVDGPDWRVGGPRYGDLLRLGPDFPLFSNTGYRVVNGTVDWDLGWASLVSSTSYGELDQHRLQGTNPQRLDQNLVQDKFTQELRLASPSSDVFEWMVGFYYTRENGLIDQHLNFAGLIDTIPGLTPLLASILGITEPEVLDLSFIDVGLDSVYTENAVFGAATYHFTPQFDLSLGARFSRNDQEFAQIIGHTPVSSLPFLFGSINSGSESSKEDVTTYSIAPRWRFSDTTMIYGRVASGFRPGGPNVLVAGSAIPPTFASDTLVNYEFGIKTDLIDNLLRVDAAVFYIDWKDIQLLFAEETPAGTVSGNANGGNAVSQGLEWSVTLTPADGLSVLWTGAYTDATLDGDPPTGAALRMQAGDRLPFSPEWSSSIDVDYEWDVFGDASAYVGAGARYVGEQMSTFATIFDPTTDLRQVELPSYTIVDLRAGLHFDAFTVELFGRNVSDERGPTRIPATATSDEAAVLRPRTIGVTLTAEF